jgi:hypothetical protein
VPYYCAWIDPALERATRTFNTHEFVNRLRYSGFLEGFQKGNAKPRVSSCGAIRLSPIAPCAGFLGFFLSNQQNPTFPPAGGVNGVK